jgi:hypothetical protein
MAWSGFMASEIGGDPLSELQLADVFGTLGFGASFEETANYLIDRFTGVTSSPQGSPVRLWISAPLTPLDPSSW